MLFAFVWVPGKAEFGNKSKKVIPTHVIVRTECVGNDKGCKVVFDFGNRSDTVETPDITPGSGDHTRIGTGGSSTKGIALFCPKFPIGVGDNHERFVLGTKRNSTMEFGNVHGTRLGTRRCGDNLNR